MAEIDGIDIDMHYDDYLEDVIVDGEITEYEDRRIERHDDLTLGEAIDLLRREGVSFDATGNQWAGQRDGSHVVDWGRGLREEVTAFVVNIDSLPGYVFDALVAGVDSQNHLSPRNLRRLEHRERSSTGAR